mgnify:FL=1|jgi:hypothetical protein
MNTLSNVLILMIFIYVALIVGVPGTTTDNVLRQKFFLFAGITIFQFLLHVVTQIRKNPEKRVKVNNMISDSVQTASAAVIGFSVYVDLVSMGWSKIMLEPYLGTRHKNSLIITLTIISFVGFLKVFKSITNDRF